MRIMALYTIPDRRRMDRLASLYLLLVVTAEAERLGGRRDQLDAGNVAAHPNFMTAQASRRDGRVDRLPFALIFVALEALGRIDVLLEGDRVSLRQSRRYCHNHEAENLNPSWEGPPG